MTQKLNDAGQSSIRLTGTVIGVRDCGTLVILYLDSGDGRVIPVPMDHRAFRHLLQGKAFNLDGLIGRSVACDGDLLSLIG